MVVFSWSNLESCTDNIHSGCVSDWCAPHEIRSVLNVLHADCREDFIVECADFASVRYVMLSTQSYELHCEILCLQFSMRPQVPSFEHCEFLKLIREKYRLHLLLMSHVSPLLIAYK